MTRRGGSDIMYDILKIIAQGVTLRTHIMYQSNTSWTCVMKFLNHLEKNNCITYINKHYHITDKGARLLSGMERLREMSP